MAESEFKSKGGLQRVLNAARYSMQGFRAALNYEAAFRQELALAILMLPLSFWLAANRWELLAMLASMLLVLIIELFNSALEALADEVSIERRERLGRAKDMGSAAVFLALSVCVFTWVAVLWPRVFS